MDVLRIQVFFCRTAHQVLYVPPEVLRNGRFGEIFFVARPDANVRAEIFRIHLDKRRIDWGAFSLIPLADASDGFSGAEIEQAVVGAMYAAHAEGTPLSEAQLLCELGSTRPSAVLMGEKEIGRASCGERVWQ